MSDWRLNGQEEYLSGATLYKVTFLEFWEAAYKTKNSFYQKIVDYAERYVAENKQGAEYLEGEKIRHFWHEHCEFCWHKAETETENIFFCTKDMYRWICEDCFRDFRERFNWQEKTSEELFD